MMVLKIAYKRNIMIIRDASIAKEVVGEKVRTYLLLSDIPIELIFIFDYLPCIINIVQCQFDLRQLQLFIFQR